MNHSQLIDEYGKGGTDLRMAVRGLDAATSSLTPCPGHGRFRKSSST